MTDLEWDTLAEQVAYSCEGFDIVNQQVRLPNGTETEFDYLSETESVVILPFDTDGNVVVIEEWRQAVRRVNRGLPAGNLESGEDPDLTTVEPANGYADSLFHYFVAEGCEPAGDQSLDVDESIEVGTADYEDLLAAIRDGEFPDGRSALAICYFELFAE
ncbi:NUDIX hydrolase [Halobacteriales archaeon QS_4_66_20]|nr:MAG: NUDIX hydrolase [Halobacteriales archaeon QS_4_66_20]